MLVASCNDLNLLTQVLLKSCSRFLVAGSEAAVANAHSIAANCWLVLLFANSEPNNKLRTILHDKLVKTYYSICNTLIRSMAKPNHDDRLSELHLRLIKIELTSWKRSKTSRRLNYHMNSYIVYYIKALNLKSANMLTPNCRRGIPPPQIRG